MFLLRVVALRSMQNLLLNTIFLFIELSTKHAIFLAVVGVGVAAAVVSSLVSGFKCQIQSKTDTV